MNRISVILLHVNGWTAVLIGSMIAFNPAAMMGTFGLPSELSVGLLSELRAPGGLLITCGLGNI